MFDKTSAFRQKEFWIIIGCLFLVDVIGFSLGYFVIGGFLKIIFGF